MTSSPSPWDDISTPDRDYNVKLVPGTSVVPVYWGRDTAGRCLLIVQLEGDHTAEFLREAVSLTGIETDLRRLDTLGRQGVVLTLEKHVDRDLFQSLSSTLIDRIREVSDSRAAVSVTLSHLKRWRAFLAGRKRRLLSAEELRGLFAELCYLRELYRRGLDAAAAVAAWCGPDGIHQDFIFRDSAVEVKALSGRERSTVAISSENQLEALSSNLFLHVVRLVENPEHAGARSLNDLVSLIESEIDDPDAAGAFMSTLGGFGYVDLPDYDVPRLLAPETWTYRVREGFPRLRRSELPQGVERVRYEIRLETMAGYECPTAETWE